MCANSSDTIKGTPFAKDENPLIRDEVGFEPMTRQEASLFFRLVSHRYQEGAIIITTSNPWLSIDPILSLSDIRTTIKTSSAPVIAVAPIIGGRAIKGPTVKLMREIGIEPSVLGIAEHYREILDGLIIDNQDAELQDAIEAMGIKVKVCNTMMLNLSDKIQLAEDTLEFAASVRTEKNT